MWRDTTGPNRRQRMSYVPSAIRNARGQNATDAACVRTHPAKSLSPVQVS